MSERKIQIRKEAENFISTQVDKWVTAVEICIEETGVYKVDAGFSCVNSDVRLLVDREPFTYTLGEISPDDDFPIRDKEHELEAGDIVKLQFRLNDSDAEVRRASLALEAYVDG